MNRRAFLASGIGIAAQPAGLLRGWQPAGRQAAEYRTAFPRLTQQIYLNAAGMMPLGRFSRGGLERYLTFQETGDQLAYVRTMQREIRSRFAALTGVNTEEIGLVHCTKAGEQIALDAVDAIKPGGAIVTNDLHFTGSLHNLVGMKKAGRDVRIVRAVDWRVRTEDMLAAIDAKTAVVAVSLVSNINGHIEDVKTLADAAHAHGAILYADIIQAAGILPMDLEALGVDVAACSCYKWLYGVHGTGYLFVRKRIQDAVLPDRLYPGSARHNYAPWVQTPDPDHDSYVFRQRRDATRYQPGHISYLGYCAAFEGLKFIESVGVRKLREHAAALNRQLLDTLDPAEFRCITPDPQSSPILTLLMREPDVVRKKLAESDIAASVGGARLRISPAIYNNESDMHSLAAVLNRA